MDMVLESALTLGSTLAASVRVAMVDIGNVRVFMHDRLMAVPVAVPEQFTEESQCRVFMAMVSVAMPVPVCMLSGGVRMPVSVAL